MSLLKILLKPHTQSFQYALQKTHTNQTNTQKTLRAATTEFLRPKQTELARQKDAYLDYGPRKAELLEYVYVVYAIFSVESNFPELLLLLRWWRDDLFVISCRFGNV